MRETMLRHDALFFLHDVVAITERRTTITVFLGIRFSPDTEFVDALRRFSRRAPEAVELWFVFPEDVVPDVAALTGMSEYLDRFANPFDLTVRFFAVDGSGAWKGRAGDGLTDLVGDLAQGTRDEVLGDGMRQLFREGKSLVASRAGFHFAKPGGAHSRYFIRAADAMTRAQGAFFLGIALLSLVDTPPDTRILVDTAGVLPVAYAFRDLIRRLRGVETRGVDSFAGYAGYRSRLTGLSETDLILISSSTSGSLARDVRARTRIPSSRIVTLFYLAEQPQPANRGIVLCDLTNRDPDGPNVVAMRTGRESRLPPYLSYPANACAECKRGSPVVALAGDGFLPAEGTLSLRMLRRTDIPGLQSPLALDVEELEVPEADAFHGVRMFADFYGLNTFRIMQADGSSSEPRELSTRIAHLLTRRKEHRHVVARIDALVRHLVAPGQVVAAIAYVTDDESQRFAEYVASRMFPRGFHIATPGLILCGAPTTAAAEQINDPDRFSTLVQALPPNQTVMAVAAVVSSGRTLLSLSRSLRRLPSSTRLRFLVGVLHPESRGAWSVFSKTLGVRSTSDRSRLAYGWMAEREAPEPDLQTAWTREYRTLLEARKSAEPPARLAIDARINTLRTLDQNQDQLFVAPRLGDPDPGRVASINPMFSFWDFEWSRHPRFEKRAEKSPTPTQAEVFATIAYLMHESRYNSQDLDERFYSLGLQGFALNPAVFDRLNEPQIQASILRSARNAELDYAPDKDVSRAMAEILTYVLTSNDPQSGGAANEFLISLATRLVFPESPGLRLRQTDLFEVVARVKRVLGDDYSGAAPFQRGLLSFIESRVS